MSFVQYRFAFGWRLQLCWTKKHLDGRGSVMKRTFPYPVLGSWEMLVVTPKFDSCMYWIFNMHWNYYINTTLILNSNFWYRWGSHLPSLSDGDLCDLRDLFFLMGAYHSKWEVQSNPECTQWLAVSRESFLKASKSIIWSIFQTPKIDPKSEHFHFNHLRIPPPESAPTKIPPKSKVQNYLWHIMHIHILQ